MKRAKIMLASVALVAVVAGASAFTAKEKFGSVIYKAAPGGGLATITVSNYTLVNNGSTTRLTDYFTTQFNANVTTQRVAYSQQ